MFGGGSSTTETDSGEGREGEAEKGEEGTEGESKEKEEVEKDKVEGGESEETAVEDEDSGTQTDEPQAETSEGNYPMKLYQHYCCVHTWSMAVVLWQLLITIHTQRLMKKLSP